MREDKGRVLRFVPIEETAHRKDIVYKRPLFDSKSVAFSFHFLKKQIAHCILSRVGARQQTSSWCDLFCFTLKGALSGVTCTASGKDLNNYSTLDK